MQARCKYAFYKNLEGHEMMGAWLLDDAQLALMHRRNEAEENCGKQFNISNQIIKILKD